MTSSEIDKFFDDSVAYMNARIEEAKKVWLISSYERFDLDQQSGTIRWSSNGETKLIGDFQFIGSFSETSGTWLWGWANSSMLPHLVEEVTLVRDFGLKHDLGALACEKWEATMENGWEMTAVAARLLEAQSVYRPPSNDTYAFLAIKNLRWAS